MIYVIRERDELGVFSSYVKVGFCHGEGVEHVKARLNKHQTGNPRTLVVTGMCEGGRDVESELLERFRPHRVKRRGVREWMVLDGDLAAWVETVRCESIETYVQKKSEARAEWERKNRCSKCGELTHNIRKCPVLALERQQEANDIAAGRRMASPKHKARAWWPTGAPIPNGVKPSRTFEWRGKTRAA